MTSVVLRPLVCSACGEWSDHWLLAGATTLAGPFLDLRPRVLGADTEFWVQYCPKCGYCAPGLLGADAAARLVVRSPEYQRLLGPAAVQPWPKGLRFPRGEWVVPRELGRLQWRLPRRVRLLLCHAMIKERRGDFAAAARGVLMAAWAFDSYGKDAKAARCRELVLMLMDRAEAAGQRLSEDSDVLLRADLLRRTGRFEACRNWVASRIGAVEEGSELHQCLEYELYLAGEGDAERHSSYDAACWVDERERRRKRRERQRRWRERRKKKKES